MIKIKKVTLIFALAIFTICISFTSRVYAAFSCNVALTSATVTEGQEFTININVNNISGANGLFAIGGFIEYQKDALTLLSATGGNGSTLSYNEGNGKFAVDRGSFLTGGGTIITLKFKANKAGRTTIAVKNIEATNLEDEIRPKDASTSITINPKATPTPTPVPTPNPTSAPTNPPIVTPPTQNNNQGNNNNNQGGGNNNGNNQSSNTNQSGGENQTPTPEVTPSGDPEQTPTPTPSLAPVGTPDNDFENNTGAINLTRKETNSEKQFMIYVLLIALAVVVLVTIILFCYIKIRNRNIKKLGGRI